jgi:hypothetical protein
MSDGSACEADDGDGDAESTTESDASVDVEAENGDGDRAGSVENTTPPPRDEENDEGDGDETVPTVELDLYDLSVRVSGQSTDDLDAVEDTARSLMDYLVERAHALEDRPDDRGLS